MFSIDSILLNFIFCFTVIGCFSVSEDNVNGISIRRKVLVNFRNLEFHQGNKNEVYVAWSVQYGQFRKKLSSNLYYV